MQSSKEQQGEIRKPSVINAKKQRKAIEWEKIEITSKKMRETKGIFYAKMGKIKDTKIMDLTEAEDFKKSWQ